MRTVGGSQHQAHPTPWAPFCRRPHKGALRERSVPSMEVIDVIIEAHAADTDRSVCKLMALGHRVVSFVMKRYEFPDGVEAEICGENGGIRTWTILERSTPAAGVELVTKRAYFAPYLDWSSAKPVGDPCGVKTSDVLVTKDLAVRVIGDGTERAVSVLWTPSYRRRDVSKSALDGLLKECGLALSSAAEEYIRKY
jgi:hypothetical protein